MSIFLFTARKSSGALLQALCQHREPLTDIFQRRFQIPVGQQTEPQVVADCQILKQRLLLGHVDET